MEYVLDKNRPVCPQIKELICAGIAAGEYQKDDRLQSVRETALLAGVNPNTVQKAFSELEREGLIYSRVGSGWYVADSRDTAKNMLGDAAKEKAVQFLREMTRLGLSRPEIVEIIQEVTL